VNSGCNKPNCLSNILLATFDLVASKSEGNVGKLAVDTLVANAEGDKAPVCVTPGNVFKLKLVPRLVKLASLRPVG